MTEREAKLKIVEHDPFMSRSAFVLKGHAGAMSLATAAEIVFDTEAENNTVLQKELEKLLS